MARNDIDPTVRYDQLWDDFDNIYIDFSLEYTQQLLVYHLAMTVFEEFPKNMPPDIITPVLGHRYASLAKEIEARGLVALPGPTDAPDLLASTAALKQAAAAPLDARQTLIAQLFQSVYSLSRWGKKLDYGEFSDFARVVHIQHVVTNCAFAEGLFSNFARYFAHRPPNPFSVWQSARHAQQSKSRPKSRSSALSTGAEFDQYLFEMGRGDFLSKLSTFESAHGVSFALSASQKHDLKDLFLLRNHLIHNSGLATERSIRESTRWTATPNGTPLPLLPAEIDGLLDTLTDVGYVMYEVCSLALLHKSRHQLFLAPQRA